MKNDFEFMTLKRAGTSVIAISLSFALLAGCSGALLDARDIPVSEQHKAEQNKVPGKAGIEVAILDKERLADEASATEPRDVEIGTVTTGEVYSDVPLDAGESGVVEVAEVSFWDNFIESEHYPVEASHGSDSITLAARSEQAERIQLASLQDITDVAQSGEAEEEYDGDPFEPVNRFFFAINETVETFVLRPVAVTYNFWVPQGVRNTVRNFLRNLRTPIVLANDIFQGNLDRAETTAARFFLNTTVGVGGLFDVATDEGWDYHNEDFGQTLGVHGFGEGAYLVLPVFGPSSARDGIGMIVDYFLDPLTYLTPWETRAGLATTRAVDSYSRRYELLDDLKRDSIDYYSRIRSLYRQTREHEINNGDPDMSPAPEMTSEVETSSNAGTTGSVE